jgi:arylsulfatase A-like enzyme
VIFTSDGGYYQGEHGGLYDKRSVYEPSIRVPMLVRFPRLIRPGTVVLPMVLNIDIAPTLLDLAGVEVPATMQGRSFTQLLEGKEVKDWRTSFLLEYFQEWRGFTSTPTLEGVRTEGHKYVRYLDPPDRPELYDLNQDPHERTNRHDDPDLSDTRSKLQRELDRLRKTVGTADTTTQPGTTR